MFGTCFFVIGMTSIMTPKKEKGNLPELLRISLTEARLNTRTMCEIRPNKNKDTRRQWRRSGVFIVGFERIHPLLWCFHCCFEQVNATWEAVHQQPVSMQILVQT